MGWRPGQTRVKVSAYGRSQLCRVPALTAAVAATGDMRAETPLTRQREVPWEHEEHLSSSPDCQVYYITAAARKPPRPAPRVDQEILPPYISYSNVDQKTSGGRLH